MASILYAKLLRISTKVRRDAGVGKVLTLMGNDIDRIFQMVKLAENSFILTPYLESSTTHAMGNNGSSPQ